MPVTTSYPGVYIEEIPSGVRTITGVATSITAFIGRAERGPVNVATVINSLGDYERIFGAIQMYSPMAFAVRDFYLNGGSRAVIVRLFKTVAATTPKAVVTIPVTGAPAVTVKLQAASPGTWGQELRATIDWNVSAASATAMGVTEDDLFNLTVEDEGTGAVEVFRNVTLINSTRRVDKVLEADSKLVTWLATGGIAVPAASTPAAFTAKTATDSANDDVTEENPTLAGALTAMGGHEGTFLTYSAGGGTAGDDGDFSAQNARTDKKGIYALEQTDLFNILVVPPYEDPGDDVVSGDIPSGDRIDLYAELAVYCQERRAMLLVDPPSDWNEKDDARDDLDTDIGLVHKNAAIYFPRLRKANPLRGDRLEEFVPSGAIAGIWARTDTARGVWKAPAGLEATLVGIPELEVNLTDLENGELNPLGINCLRTMPAAGRIVWGARTLEGDDRLSSDWKYVPVRRTALFIEESLFRGTQWVVFEPNDEPLWAQIRLNVGAFMHGLFRQGAFQGKTPKEAYFVKCDKETTTQDDINKGVVNIVVGFAPLKPAEFVIIKLQQMAGQVAA